MRHDVDAGYPIDLPELFCWTKYGAEAGESASEILARKDAERGANDGIFLWGIGNAVGPSIRSLLAETEAPKVVFTPMLSKPAPHDVAPSKVAVWHRGIALDGMAFDLPAHSHVTSRATEAKRAHYALVCRSEEPLSMATEPDRLSFSAAEMTNLRSGSRVGASQVTAVVRRVGQTIDRPPTTYSVSFCVDLVEPYFVRLTEHSLLTNPASS